MRLERARSRQWQAALESAAIACETMAAESSENGLRDACDSWQRDANDLREIAKYLEGMTIED